MVNWATLPSASASVDLRSISGTNATTMSIAGGTGSLVYTFDGTSATLRNNFPTAVGAMWVADANNIWSVGGSVANAGAAASGMILKYNGTSWGLQPSGTTASLGAIWGTDVNNIWSGGNPVSNNVTILKYNGTTWSSQSPSPAINAAIYDMWGSSATDIWAVGSSILHTTDGGASWSTVSSPTTMSLTSISGVDANNIWASGNTNSPSISSVILKYDGTSWTQQYTVSSIYINGIYAADANRIWAAGTFGSIYYSSNGGTNWAPQSSGTGAAFYGIHGKDRYNIWAFGTKVIKWNGSAWSAAQSTAPITTTGFFNMTHYDSPVPLNPNGILSTTNLFLMGQNGTIMASTDNQIVLPVELLSFTAKAEGSSNKLTWTTASEVNNKGFQIEKLKATGDSWDILGFVASKSPKGTSESYDFLDIAPLSTSYYRLRQMDNDGQETLSKVVSVSNKGNSKLKVYPNPVSNSLTIETDPFNKGEALDYQIINLLGQQVQSGKATNSIDVSKLLIGTYFLKVGDAQMKFIKK